jgi:hypothetical protein
MLMMKLGERHKPASSFNAIPSVDADAGWKGFGMLVATAPPVKLSGQVGSLATTSLVESSADVRTSQSPQSSVCGCSRPRKRKLILPILSYSTLTTIDQPSPLISFPLSADHRLITLVQYNVIRGVMLNMAILSLTGHLPKGCPEALQTPSLGVVPPERVPYSLRQTLLQQSTPHVWWIRPIPFPAMRDNLIRLYGQYSGDDFLHDLGNGLYEGFDDVERRGFLVWGDPWQTDGWEVSEGFVEKWGFLLKGCTELIDSTNKWREMRGEDRLVVEV